VQADVKAERKNPVSKAAIWVWYILGAVVLAIAVANFFFDLNWYS
jgi:uncharacterized membrane protein YwzB